MRLYSENVLTTLKEDGMIYQLVMDALDKNPADVQLRVLGRVKHHHLERNANLTRGLYDSFMVVLDELGIDHTLPKQQDNLRNGNLYVIPASDKLYNGENREKRLNRRNMKRLKMWSAITEKLGYTMEEIDMKLAIPESGLDKAIEPYRRGLEDMKEFLQKQLDEQKQMYEQKLDEQKQMYDQKLDEHTQMYDQKLDEQKQVINQQLAMQTKQQEEVQGEMIDTIISYFDEQVLEKSIMNAEILDVRLTSVENELIAIANEKHKRTSGLSKNLKQRIRERVGTTYARPVTDKVN